MKSRLSLFAALAIPAALVAYLYYSQPHDQPLVVNGNPPQVSQDAKSPVPLDKLGLVKEHKEHAVVVAAATPVFRIFGAPQDNTKKNVRLWDAVTKVRGEHLPNIPQQTGDCVSFGSANAENYLQYQQIEDGELIDFKVAFPPFNYGASRIDIGSKYGSHFKGDGSVGAYAAEAARDLGFLASDTPQCPPYSGEVAKKWGNSGPPQWAKDAAKDHRVQTIAQMKTANDIRDALCNKYPVIICSDFGTLTIRPQDGRQVARHDASWDHCMCVIGYDGSGRQPYFYILNSWGPDAHPEPLQGEPPGGFWIDLKTMTYIVKSGDCWAYSAVQGFPATLDVSPLRPKKAARRVPVQPRQNQRAVNPFQVAQSFGGSKL